MLIAECRRARNHSQRGLTLVELMIVVIVVGILAAIALPAYQEQVRKSRRADAYHSLLLVQNLQEKWRASNSSYSNSLVEIGFVGTASQEEYYGIGLSGAGAVGYTVTATAQGAQTGDSRCTSIVLTVGAASPRGTKTPAACW